MKSLRIRSLARLLPAVFVGATLVACSREAAEQPAPTAPAGDAATGQPAAGPVADPTGSATLGDLSVTGAWARATPPGTPVGAVYLVVTNRGTTEDTLMAVSSPAAAAAELHESTTENGVAQMRPLGPQVLSGGQSLTAEPGGLHLMLNDLTAPLVAGQTVPLALSFKFAGTMTVQVPVRPLAAATEHAHAGH